MNTICTVECKSGYELEGSSTAVCTSQGNWNPGSPPRCTGKVKVVEDAISLRFKKIK